MMHIQYISIENLHLCTRRGREGRQRDIEG
jgi:hypothetical protein